MSLISRDQPLGLFEHERLEREAARDAAELRRITQPLPLECFSDSAYVIRYGCTGSCSQGDRACNCGAAPVTSAQRAAALALAGWRGFFEVEWDHPALLALYVLLVVLVIAVSAAYPWGFAS